MDLHFENSGLAGPYLAVFGVTVLALLAAVRKRRRLLQICDPSLLPRTWLPGPTAASRTRNELLFWFAIGAFLTGALLQPQWGYVWRETKRRGVDIIIAVDVSESMMAADVQPNRLARARYKIRDLVEHLKGDRIGLVAFAGTAFIESPLTVDYGTFRLFLDSLNPELIPIQGTNIRAALEKSLEALGYQSIDEPPPPGASAKSQAILLITDGEDFEGDFSKLGEFAAAQGVQIYIIGIGTKEGGPIPVGKGFKRDKSGKMVLTHLDESKLVDLAKKTGGIYVEGRGGDEDIGTIYDRGIRTFLESRTIEGGPRRLWNERFQVPLLFAISLLFLGPWGGVLAAFRSRRSKGPISRAIEHSVLVVPLLIMSLLFCSPARADSESAGYEGKQDLIAGNFNKAQAEFSTALSGTPPDLADPRLYFGLGESNYRLGRFKESAEAFSRAAELSAKQAALGGRSAADLQSQAQYNRANALVQLGQYQPAIDAYLAAQKIRPNDKEIADNLAYTRRLLAQRDDKKSEEPKKDSQQKRQEPNQQDQQSEKNRQEAQQDSTEQQNSEQKSQQDQQDQHNHGQKEQDSQDQSNSDPNQQQSKDRGSNEQHNQNEENKEDQQQGNPNQKQQPQQGHEQKDSQKQSSGQEDEQKDQQSDNEGDKQQQQGGGEKNQGAASNSGHGDSNSDPSRQQGADGGDTGDSGQSNSQGYSHSGSSKQAGTSTGRDGDDRSQGNQAGEQSKQADGKDGQEKAAEGTKPDSTDQGKTGEEKGGTGSDKPDIGQDNKAGGEKKGQDSSAAGSDIEPEKGGEDSSLTAKDRSKTQSAGTKSETTGATLNRNEYATPLGADEGNSGGEGAKDTLAVKEGKGDHTGLSGPESAGSQRDGSGKAAVESFLENVGEERGMYLKYREQKGLQQLRTEGREMPDKDW